MTADRAPGLYRVLFGYIWTVARYDLGSTWYVIGSDSPGHEHDFAEIGPRVESPEEMKAIREAAEAIVRAWDQHPMYRSQSLGSFIVALKNALLAKGPEKVNPAPPEG